MKIINVIAALTISSGLAFGVVAQAQEENGEQVQLKDLPEAAQKTIKEKVGAQAIARIERETRQGKIVYEAFVNKDGKESAIAVDQNGKYLNQHNEAKEHKEKANKY